METQPTSIFDGIELILFLGSFTFLLGAFFQAYVLYSRRIGFVKSLAIVALTRICTLALATVIWVLWVFPFDVMFLFLFLPALVPELILSPLLLKWFGVLVSDE